MRAVTDGFSKVPEITIGFWIIKIAATTLGETGGDTVTMTLDWGYLAGTALFLASLIVLVIAQILAKTISALSLLGHDRRLHHLRHNHGRFRGPLAGHRLYRRLDAAVRVPRDRARPVVSIAGHCLREYGEHAKGGGLLLGSHHVLADTWDRTRRLDGRHRRAGIRRWCARLRGRARGDRGPILLDKRSRVLLFWAAFILTRPFGATVGDFLDKPLAQGGLALSRPHASAVIAAFIVACLLVLPQRAGRHPRPVEQTQ